MKAQRGQIVIQVGNSEIIEGEMKSHRSLKEVWLNIRLLDFAVLEISALAFS